MLDTVFQCVAVLCSVVQWSIGFNFVRPDDSWWGGGKGRFLFFYETFFLPFFCCVETPTYSALHTNHAPGGHAYIIRAAESSLCSVLLRLIKPLATLGSRRPSGFYDACLASRVTARIQVFFHLYGSRYWVSFFSTWSEPRSTHHDCVSELF